MIIFSKIVKALIFAAFLGVTAYLPTITNWFIIGGWALILLALGNRLFAHFHWSLWVRKQVFFEHLNFFRWLSKILVMPYLFGAAAAIMVFFVAPNTGVVINTTAYLIKFAILVVSHAVGCGIWLYTSREWTWRVNRNWL